MSFSLSIHLCRQNSVSFLWLEAPAIKQFVKISAVIQCVSSLIIFTFNIAKNEMKFSYSGITQVIIKVLIGI